MKKIEILIRQTLTFFRLFFVKARRFHEFAVNMARLVQVLEHFFQGSSRLAGAIGNRHLTTTGCLVEFASGALGRALVGRTQAFRADWTAASKVSSISWSRRSS